MHQSQEEIDEYRKEVEADVNQLLEDTGSDFTLDDVKDVLNAEGANPMASQLTM